MTVVTLRADCGRCAALCCAAFEFEKSAEFAIAKPAGAPCPRLDRCGRCGIYDRREAEGFGGCLQYDCLGAGQRVVAAFEGRTWMDEPELLAPMLRAFETMRRVHDLLTLLAMPAKADLAPAAAEQRQQFVDALNAIAEAVRRRDAAARLRVLDGPILRFLRAHRPGPASGQA